MSNSNSNHKVPPPPRQGVTRIKPFSTSPSSDLTEMMAAVGSGGQGTPVETLTQPMIQSAAHANSVAGLVVGKPYLLPLSCFRASKFNARVFYAQDDIDMTAQSIRSNGQDVPVLGYVQDDHVVIIDGQKRFTACNTGQIEKLLAYIVDKPESPAEEYEMSRRINLERTSQTPFDDAVRFKELLDQKVYPDQKQMAGRLGLSEETLSRTMQLSLIPPVFRRMMAEHPTSSTLSIAYELSRLSKEAPKFGDNFDALFEEVIATVNKKELSRIATRALVESKLTGPRTRAQSNSVPFDFGGKQGLIKTIPAKGEFNLSITGLSPENIEKLGVKIRDLVASME